MCMALTVSKLRLFKTFCSMEWFLPLKRCSLWPYVFCAYKKKTFKKKIPHSVRLLCRLLNVFVPCALIKYAFIKFKDM